MQSTKYALVLGNGAYEGIPWLRCPKSDAEQTAAALARLQFVVTLGIDLKYDQVTSLIDNFIDRIAKATPFVTVVYYSGHGLQDEDQNFILPVDFQADDGPNLVSVQAILDRVSRHSNLQIVLLDACRSNAEPQEILRGKSAGAIGVKARQTTNHQEQRTGLAEMHAPSSTFIAFAAAPGDIALDGDRSALSPFTGALLKHIELVDIPLPNLMSRVRQEVYRTTNYEQQTWDHSSLMVPFYFNPGSMFLFMGNALAIFALLVSMIPYSLSLASPEMSWSMIAVSSVFPLVSLFVLMFGAHTVYSRLRGATQEHGDGLLSLKDYFLVSLRKGSVGGFIGSIVAAVIIGCTYDLIWILRYHQWVEQALNVGTDFVRQPESWNLITAFSQWVARALSGGVDLVRKTPPPPLSLITTSIAVATTICGCILGFLSLFFARVDVSAGKLKVSSNASHKRTLLGCVFGGALSGIICAPIVTYYFGTQAGPPAMPQLLLSSGIVGTAVLVFSIVNFDFERLSKRRLGVSLLCALGAVAIGALVAAPFIAIFSSMGLIDAILNWLKENSDDALVLMAGGAVYGLFIGPTLGGVIGLAVILTSHWTERDVLETGS